MGEKEGVSVAEVGAGEVDKLEDERLDVVDAIAEDEAMNLLDLVHLNQAKPVACLAPNTHLSGIDHL